jgi:hypothetical protein
MLFNDGFIEFADIALGDNVASIHDVKTVANVHAEIEILFDEQNANFAFTSKLLNSVANLLEALFAGVVETVRPKFFDGFADLVDNVGLDALGRLVQEQHFWIGEQGPANGELLLLASAEHPALALVMSCKIGKSEKTRSTWPVNFLPCAMAPIRRFSITVRFGKMSRPCGT